jgi:hypothetical protein
MLANSYTMLDAWGVLSSRCFPQGNALWYAGAFLVQIGER